MITRPTCGILRCPSGLMTKPNPSCPIRQPACRITRSPIKACADRHVRRRSQQLRPIRTSGADDGVGADHGARSDLGARPDDRSRIDGHAAFQARARMDDRASGDAGSGARSKQRRRPQRVGKQARAPRRRTLRNGFSTTSSAACGGHARQPVPTGQACAGGAGACLVRELWRCPGKPDPTARARSSVAIPVIVRAGSALRRKSAPVSLAISPTLIRLSPRKKERALIQVRSCPTAQLRTSFRR